ncbi:MAG: protein kinase, partial [Cyanobacteriota bacterium]
MNRYKVVRELGRNREGGRITYLATDTRLNPPQQVVIKEFRFAASGANWSGFKAYQREIEVLRELNHPRIPRYLDSFQTKSGFCLVQEYKNAPFLAQKRNFTPEEIKKIAVSVLEILVDLQKRTPPVLHRDIKPENILVDRQLNAYLIDFGFARIRGGELAISSVAAGTPGFMPPEEQFGRPLTEASDLYSLGATLICLLTGTRSQDIGNLIDNNYRFNVKKLLPHLNPRFISWLEKMVAPNLKQRFNNAAVALAALQPIQVVGGATCIERLGYAITHPRLGISLFRRNDSRKTRRLRTVLLGLVVVLVIALGLSLFRTNTETTTTATSSFYYSVIGLGTLGGNFSEADDLNDAGQVVGGSTINNPNFTRHAFLWENGTMTDLGTLGGKSSHAHAINNQGQVVGNSDTPDDFDGGARHAFLWNNNTMTALGTLDSQFSFANDINDKGQVVGKGFHAFLWENGTMTDLGTLVGDKYSDAKGINDAGQVV